MTISLNAPLVNITGNVAITGDVVIGGVSFLKHIHEYGDEKNTKVLKEPSL